MADREIGLPFKLDGQGRIATISDPVEVARQHLTTYLVTSPGERIMRPSFGSPIRDYVFEALDPLQIQLLASRTSERVARDVPNITLQDITATADSDQAEVLLTVEFAMAVGAGEGEIRSTTITMGGAG